MIVRMKRTRTRRSQAQRSSETRAALLDATLDLLVESGYKATTTTAVAFRAGVSLGALLHHFPTKTDLLTAAIDHAFARRSEEFQRTLTDLGAAGDKLDEVVDVLWSMFSGTTFIAFVELWVAARTEPELADALVAVDREFQASCQRLYAEYFGDQQSSDIARIGLPLVFSLLNGVAFSKMIPGYEPFEPAVVIDAFKAMVCAALAASPPPGPGAS